MSTAPLNDAETAAGDWRKKHKRRFTDGELVAIRYETGLAEVFLYHERICDLIDDARTNLVNVSLFTLARDVHDDPFANGIDFEQWAQTRARILELMRSKGLIEFDGDVYPYVDLAIHLPAETYRKWHLGRRGDNGRDSGRDDHGRFTKTPANTGTHRNTPDAVVPEPFPHRSGPDSHRRPKTLDKTSSLPSSAEPSPAQQEEQEMMQTAQLLAERCGGGVDWYRGRLESHRIQTGTSAEDYLDTALDLAKDIDDEMVKPKGDGLGLYFNRLQRTKAAKSAGRYESPRVPKVDANLESLRSYLAGPTPDPQDDAA